MSTVYVYALAEPDTGEIRYIGLTEGLAYRFKHHMSNTELSKKNPRALWLRSLRDAGMEPRMIVLETLHDMGFWFALPVEKAWIKFYCAQGANLTNTIHNERLKRASE
jgi:hypothetical protein